MLVKASTESTNGAFAIIEEVAPLDTPLHVHANVIEGEHVFTVGEEEFPAGPGAVVFAPRQVAHAHRRLYLETTVSGRVFHRVGPTGVLTSAKVAAPPGKCPTR